MYMPFLLGRPVLNGTTTNFKGTYTVHQKPDKTKCDDDDIRSIVKDSVLSGKFIAAVEVDMCTETKADTECSVVVCRRYLACKYRAQLHAAGGCSLADVIRPNRGAARLKC